MLRLLIFLYTLTQVLCYDDLTIVPKIFGLLLSLYVIVLILKTKRIQPIAWPIYVLIILVIHAILTFTFWPNDTNSVSAPSFLLVSIFLLFYYQAVLISKSWIVPSLGLISGVIINLFLIAIGAPEMFNDAFRLEGTLGNPNFFGYITNISMVFLLLIIRRKTKVNNSTLLIIVYILFGLLIIFTGSKANIVIYVMIILANIITYSNAKTLLQLSLFTGLSIFIVGIVIQSSLVNSDILSDYEVTFSRIEYIFGFLSGSSSLQSTDVERLSMIEYVVDNWTTRPLFGHGYDAYTVLSGFNTYSHNNLAENLFNNGLLGTVLYYSIYPFLFYRTYHINKQFAVQLLIVLLVMEMSIILIDNKVIWMIYIIIISYKRVGGKI